MILAIKSAGPETELYILTEAGKELDRRIWQSGRQLAEGLLAELEQFMGNHGGFKALAGLIVFCGPGSFTSLRISVGTVNALAYALAIPNVGAEGEDWLKSGLDQLAEGRRPQIILPAYDREPNTTLPKK